MPPIPTELRELLERIVAGDVGRMIYAKLATGQATETDDGKAWLELRALLATPPADAADMGGQAGEEVEVMAYAVDHPEAGYKVYKQFSQWMNGGEWRCDSLMAVAQHQRITAAMAAEVGRLKLLERVFDDVRAERDELVEASCARRAECKRLAEALDRQSVITGDYIARCQRLADELAITRRVIDRIGQLCTTPHESKERFIRRVQSVIEWERAAQQDQPK